MIVGGSKKDVIANIKKNANNKDLNVKCELDDPSFTEEESKKALERFYKIRKNKIAFFFKNKYANHFLNKFQKDNCPIEIEGLDNINSINDGGIITCNHFNPLDSLAPRMVIKKAFNKDMYIVSQETNLALPGFLSFLTNHLSVVPLRYSTNYIINEFTPKLIDILNKKNYVLIYPEEEMWFNYKKPRTCKRGAYEYAAKAGKPIISCFTEIVNLDEDDNEEFKKVKYIIHVLKPIYPDKDKTARSNSIEMAEIDYKQKCEAYEKFYNKKLDYKFDYEDIAGYKKPAK